MTPLRPLAALALTACCTLCGCATVYVDDDGATHVVGLVWLKVAPPAWTTGAESVRVRSVGVSALRLREGGGVSVGYSEQQLTTIRDNQYVDATKLPFAR